MDLNFDMGNAFGEIYTLIAPPAAGPVAGGDRPQLLLQRPGRVRGPRARPRGDARKGSKYALDEWRALGFDQHSVFADPLFVDPAQRRLPRAARFAGAAAWL